MLSVLLILPIIATVFSVVYEVYGDYEKSNEDMHINVLFGPEIPRHRLYCLMHPSLGDSPFAVLPKRIHYLSISTAIRTGAIKRLRKLYLYTSIKGAVPIIVIHMNTARQSNALLLSARLPIELASEISSMVPAPFYPLIRDLIREQGQLDVYQSSKKIFFQHMLLFLTVIYVVSICIQSHSNVAYSILTNTGYFV